MNIKFEVKTLIKERWN